MNGAADPQVSPSHALELASAFDRLRKPYELKIFYGEGHISPRRVAERVMDISRWFGRFDESGNQPNRH
jgi:dipeptidyl aminopeptidase/acylaminoacyl peptidase